MRKYPNNLAVYLSNRCNLSCSYCYVAVNQGEAAYLDVPALKKSIAYFLSLPQPAEAASQPENFERKISFLGGEPLLKFNELAEVIRHIRSLEDTRLIIHLFTNGALLDKAKLGFLLDNRVEVTLSLDGKKETNDAYRIFASGENKSVYEEVLRRLEGLPKDKIGVNMVFTRHTAPALLSNIHHFYEQGFSKISFTPDLYDPWSAEELENLDLIMNQFSRYYRLLASKGARLFAISNLYAVLEKTTPTDSGRKYWWQDCHNLVLGADGRFYNCDKPLGFTFDKIDSYAVGSVEGGVDWISREEDFQKAAAYIDQTTGKDKEFFSCPMGVYFTSRIKGQEPSASVLNFQNVSGVYSRALLNLYETLKHNERFLSVHGLKREAAAV